MCARTGYSLGTHTATPHLACLATIGNYDEMAGSNAHRRFCSGWGNIEHKMNELSPSWRRKMTKWCLAWKELLIWKVWYTSSSSGMVQMLWCRAVAVTGWCRVEWYWYKYLYGYGYGYENMRIWDVWTSGQYCPISTPAHQATIQSHNKILISHFSLKFYINPSMP